MAIKTLERKKDNTLGMLGTLASVAGMATGQPWLSALGAGMQGANSMMNGDRSMQTAQKTSGAMSELLSGLKDAWNGWEEPCGREHSEDSGAECYGKGTGTFRNGCRAGQ